MANGHNLDPAQLHKDGCSFGQKLQIHQEYTSEEIKEIKTLLVNIDIKVDKLKEELITEITKNNALRKTQSAVISALTALIVLVFGEAGLKWIDKILGG